MKNIKKIICFVLAMGCLSGCSFNQNTGKDPLAKEKEIAKKQYLLNNTLMIESDFIKVDESLEVKQVVDNLGTAQITFKVVDARVYNFLRSSDDKLFENEEDLLYETILEFNGKHININNKTLYTYAVVAKELNMLCLIDMTSHTLLGFDGVEIESKRDDIVEKEKAAELEKAKENSENQPENTLDENKENTSEPLNNGIII